VLRHDGAERDVYFVIAGAVRLAVDVGRGRQLILRDMAAGDLFGELPAIDGRGRFSDAIALRESFLASMSPEAFRSIVASHPSVRERLLRRLTSSIRELADRVLHLGATRVQGRVWNEILRLARLAGVSGNA